MVELSAVRRLEHKLADDGITVLLVNIHSMAGRILVERYHFELSPTYILFDEDGEEIRRSHRLFSREEVLAAVSQP